jgi:hypothetical protein
MNQSFNILNSSFASKAKSQIASPPNLKKKNDEVNNFLNLSESMDSISSKKNLKKFITPKTEKFEGYSNLDGKQIAGILNDPYHRNFSFGPQRVSVKVSNEVR